MFSDNEEKVLKILGNKKMSITEITHEFFDGDVPFEGSNRVAGVVRRIESKVNGSDLSWTLEGEGTGRKGKVIWKKEK